MDPDQTAPCDRSSSVVRRVSCVNFFFKRHLLLNHWSFKIIARTAGAHFTNCESVPPWSVSENAHNCWTTWYMYIWIKFCIFILRLSSHWFAKRFYSRPAGLEVIKLESNLRLKIKSNDWLLADTCPQAANHCASFWVWDCTHVL